MTRSAGAKVGRYTLTHLIEKGGMGEVWLAREDDTRDVAIKFIISEQQSTNLAQRFAAEIKTITQLKSPNVVQVYAWDKDETGAPYMVMEYLQGESLATILKQGPIKSVALAVDYLVQVCAALVQAHSHKIIHRDLKPANLFVERPNGQVKVLDFGVAKATEQIRAQLTNDGVYVGTLNYSAPEQLIDSSKVTAASDLWSVGAVLYELLTGTMAFPGEFPAVATAIQDREPADIRQLRPDVPKELANCIQRCLAKDPGQRYGDARLLIRDLAIFGGADSLAIRNRLCGDVATPHDLANVLQYSATQLAPTPVPPLRHGALRQPAVAFSRTFHSEADLIEAIRQTRTTPDGTVRQVVFMLGAGFSMSTENRKGVPGTGQIVELIRSRLNAQQRQKLDSDLSVADNKYQYAFRALARTRTVYVANKVVREAILTARVDKPSLSETADEQQRQCSAYEQELGKWSIPEGVTHMGALVAKGLERAADNGVTAGQGDSRFSRIHLTSNFDPLLAISIKHAGGTCFSYATDNDYEIPEPDGEVCLIIHLHGRWNKGVTLHDDLNTPRPQLEASLTTLLNRSVVVVLGYGGWDDVFTRTLKAAARGANNQFDVLWGFFDNDRADILKKYGSLLDEIQHLGPRIQFYRGVDTNRVFAELNAKLSISAPNTKTPAAKWKRAVVNVLGSMGLVATGLLVGAAGKKPAITPPPKVVPTVLTTVRCNASPPATVELPDGGLVSLDRLCESKDEPAPPAQITLNLTPPCENAKDLALSVVDKPGTLLKGVKQDGCAFVFQVPDDLRGKPSVFKLRPESLAIRDITWGGQSTLAAKLTTCGGESRCAQCAKKCKGWDATAKTTCLCNCAPTDCSWSCQ